VRVPRTIAPVAPALLARASLLVERALHDTRYVEGALEALDAAVRAPGVDGRALASGRDEVPEGVIVFGTFAGASGAGRIHLVAVDAAARRTGVGESLAEAAIAQLRADGARFVLAELPDDPRALPGAQEFLEALGFREESRVEHFFRDGIALSFMRRELGGRS
jgi:ribosomal protein S18 acetylase RimI-like enzyme